jgi:allantoin racemase
MRVWYQSFSRFDAFGHYGSALKQQIGHAADPGTDIEAHGLTRGGGFADQYRYPEYVDVGEVIANGLQAQKEGYDGFLLGNIVDPGFRELRELLTIPVLGLCESTLSIACMMGPTYTLVMINPKFTPRVLENVHRYGFYPRMASFETMKIHNLTDLAAGFSDAPEHAPAREAIFEEFRQAARRGIEKGAEVIVAAGGVVMAMLAHANIHEVDGVPILNGTVALTKMGETAVKIQRLTGNFISKHMTYAPPRGELLKEVRRVYGADVYPGAE